MELIKEKICTKCEESKNIEGFSWKIKAKNIRSSWCKKCQSDYDKQYYDVNSVKSLELSK